MEDSQLKQPIIRFKQFNNAWEQCKLGDLLNYEQPTKYIVKSNDYAKHFSIPVLTVGQRFILGYTNEEYGIKKASPDKPVIIFDDFTTDSRYIDFPFKIKSSAMKLLSLKNNTNDIYFIFHVLANLNYIPQNHERHWISKFVNFTVKIPNGEEQKKISKLLKILDRLIILQQRQLNVMKKLKNTLIYLLFPEKSVLFPKLRLKKFTNSWEYRKLEEIGKISTGNTPPTSDNNYEQDGMLWITPTDITSNIVKTTIKKLSKNGIKKARVATKRSILITCIASIGKNALLLENAAFNQQINALTPNKMNDSYFLLTYSTMWSNKMKSMANSGTVQIVNKTEFSKLTFSYPLLEEQKELGKFFSNIDHLISLQQRKLEQLKIIKKILLKSLFI